MGMSKLAVGVVASSLLALAGCGVPSTQQPSAEAGVIRGSVHGGQQPVGFATIQLWTVGTGGDGSPATPTLTKVVQSDANGYFTITGDYSCVNSNATEVYITAVGGFPATFMANPNLAMMTALGPCTGLGSGTTITINELTTIAAVAALQPYITGYGAVGSGTGDAGALAQAFGLAEEFVDSSTAVSPGMGAPAGEMVPSALIGTLGNVLAACVNSGGGAAGTTTGCGLLFTYVKPANGPAPTETVGALIDLLANPTNNATNLFNLATPNAPFAGMNMAPASFAIALIPTGLTLDPTSLTFPPTAVGFTASMQTVTVKNAGSVSVMIGSIAAGGLNGGDFGVSNLCPGMLAAGGSCSVQVTATPGGPGTRTGSLIVTSSLAGSPQSVGLSVTGTVPAVSLSPSPLMFATTLINATSGPSPITLNNTGTATLTISSVALTGVVNNNFTQTNNCGSVGVGLSCTIQVTFAPTSPGMQSATVNVTSNAATSVDKVTVTGTAVPMGGPSVSLSTSALTMIGAGMTEDLTLTNTGVGALTISSVTNSTGSFTVVSHCGTMVVAGGSCAISVTDMAPYLYETQDNPPSFSGPSSLYYGLDQVVIQSNDPAGPAVAMLKVVDNVSMASPANILFPGTVVGSTATTPFSVGPVYGSIYGPSPYTVTGPNAGDFTVQSVASMVFPQYLVTFHPTGSGVRTAMVTLSNYPNTGAYANYYVPLVGMGLATAPGTQMTLSPMTASFNDFSAAVPVTLANTTGATVNVQSIATSAGFSQTNNCGGAVAALASCTITVSSTQTAQGGVQGELSVTDDSGTQAISLTSSVDTLLPFQTQALTVVSPISYGFEFYGSGNVDYGSGALSGANTGDFGDPGCSGRVNVCEGFATFRPTALGLRSAILTSDGSRDSDAEFRFDTSTPKYLLLGTGVAAGANVTFGSQMEPTFAATTTFTIYNSGTTTLNLAGAGAFTVSGADAGAFTLSAGNCSTLAPGATCAFGVKFAPVRTTLNYATFTVTDGTSGMSFSEAVVFAGS